MISRLRLAFREFYTILRTGKPTFDEANAAFWVTIGGQSAIDAMTGAVR